MQRLIRHLTPWLCLLLLAGCSSLARFPDNPRLQRFEAEKATSVRAARKSGETLLILTFSGGGSRAAALAYGVLESLSKTPLQAGYPTGTLLDEVDMISAVSGGSITAAYYGLFGQRLFEDFRRDFLEKDVSDELKSILLSPSTLTRLSSETFGSGDVLDEYFALKLFGASTLDRLLDADGPFVRINATDLFKGFQFGFTADQFTLICSDVSQFPVSRAVAASSAVPLIFSPIVLTNHAGSCDFTPPAWLREGASEKGRPNRRDRIARNLNQYLQREAHPYVHLVDGGLADNLGLRAVIDYVIVGGGLWNTLKHFNLNNAQNILIISVDASALLPSKWEQSEKNPPTLAILDAATTTPLVTNNFETLEYMRNNLSQWRKDLREHQCRGNEACKPPDIYHVEVRLEDIADAEKRGRLSLVPTDFVLPAGVAGELIEAGHELLQTHTEFIRFRQAQGL
jgi:NTE family protein